MRKWSKSVARLARMSLVLVLSPLLWASSVATCSPRNVARDVLTRRGELQYQWARAHLQAPFSGYGAWDDLTVGAFDVILLSNLASGLMNVAVLSPERRGEVASLAEEVARRATSAEVAPRGTRGGRSLGDHNLYGSHLLLILSIEHRLLALDGRAPSDEHDALALGVARHLRAASLGHPSAHARSYPGSPRWPADQSVTLEALALHDREHGTALSARPIALWLTWIEGHRTGDLPWSAVSGPRYSHIPRGCALSFMTGAMARFAPTESARVYRQYRSAMGIDWWGWRGFREWPQGHDGGSDVDAGPVLLGWGTAATGIGLGAARLHGDAEMAAGIERMADTVGLGVPLSGRYLLAPTLGQAMLFSGSTATPWDEPPEVCGASGTGWPVAPVALMMVLLASMLALMRPRRER